MKILAQNKAAGYHYHILQTIEAGLALSGPEVKAAKLGQAQLKSSYASIEQNQAQVKNMYIAPYKPAQSVQKAYNPLRPRKLLLHRHEINSLIGQLKQAGISLVPLKLYTDHGYVKLELGLVRGKKKYDKRAALKRRVINREIAEFL